MRAVAAVVQLAGGQEVVAHAHITGTIPGHADARGERRLVHVAVESPRDPAGRVDHVQSLARRAPVREAGNGIARQSTQIRADLSHRLRTFFSTAALAPPG